MTRLQLELLGETTLEDIPERYRDVAGIMGVETYVKVSDYARGDEIYFPKPETLLMAARNRRIHDEYNGYNQKELAEKYDITIQQVNNILKDAPIFGQMDLFEYLSK